MNKQTAVEFLEEKAMNGFITPEDLDQAKSMEKEQIIDAYKYGNQSDVYYKPEQYYTETYESKTNL